MIAKCRARKRHSARQSFSDTQSRAYSSAANQRALRLHFIAGNLVETHERLENWGRWARPCRSPARARSIEGKYMRERLDKEVEEVRREPVLFVDALDASFVDVVLAPWFGFPRRESELLKAHYVYRAHPHAVARRTHVPLRRLSYEFDRALVTAHHALDAKRTECFSALSCGASSRASPLIPRSACTSVWPAAMAGRST